MKATLLLPFLFAPMVCLAQASAAPNDQRAAKLYEVGDLDRTQPGPDLELKRPAAPLELSALRLPARELSAPPPNLGLSTPSAGGFEILDTPDGAEAIARLMRAFVKPKLHAKEEIKSVGERWIVVLGRPEQHAWIARFLETARGDRTEAVAIACRCLSMSELTFLRDVRPALIAQGDTAENEETVATEPPTAEPPAAEVSYLTEVLAPGAATNAFLTALLERTDVTSLTELTLAVAPLRIANMATVNQTAYVRDFDVKLVKDTLIADPIVDVVQDGIMLQAAIAPLESGLLGLSLDATISVLERPIQVFKTKVGTTLELQVQLPSLKSTRLEAAVELKANHIVVMAPPPMSGQRILFVVAIGSDKFPAPQVKKKAY